ncbi:KH_dom_type_1 domain-containing protein [Nephila pilipes]|uniref:KH_dom_type_1 domain-containing protein n=1 Tax=Nephila pilipes TaxID=299642 RepID=A0A8X6J2K1_NEPPI|nr:KH_dom_type_1 domain-containing protein [Nephila pilipes]GFT71326.1 KH_dom_type_1 domain-containing protein [Nephila pilipes]GFT81398.1 KH_dom_type_1 domain-containing protein [Nephila pilipes]GFU42907.1 KH_dom_type_1 domain-containing protein [Nephila pilipes]
MIQWIKKHYIIIGVGVGISVVTTYVVKLLRCQESEEKIMQAQPNRITRTLKIPKGYVGHVVGRQGTTINSIRDRTNTRINFDGAGRVWKLGKGGASLDVVLVT